MDSSAKGLGDAEAARIGAALAANTSLVVLRLNGNRFGDGGAAALGAALAAPPRALEQLFVHDNHITDAGNLFSLRRVVSNEDNAADAAASPPPPPPTPLR